jgi:hypothetical protein
MARSLRTAAGVVISFLSLSLEKVSKVSGFYLLITESMLPFDVSSACFRPVYVLPLL